MYMDPKITKNFKKYSQYTRTLALVLALLSLIVFLLTKIVWLSRALLVGSGCALIHSVVLMLLSKNND